MVLLSHAIVSQSHLGRDLSDISLYSGVLRGAVRGATAPATGVLTTVPPGPSARRVTFALCPAPWARAHRHSAGTYYHNNIIIANISSKIILPTTDITKVSFEVIDS